MAFPIIPKRRSGATGNPASLQLGELATNTATGELFLGGDGGVMLLNAPSAAGTTVTEHTGDGTTVAFTFTGFSSTADGAYLVSVGGIDQPPSKYSVSSAAGGTITFVEAPIAGELISIRAIVAGGGSGGTDIGGRAWSNTATYSEGDLVATSQTETWICIQNANTGNDPATSPTWWDKMPANAVSLQLVPVATTTPSTNQALVYNGTDWAPADVDAVKLQGFDVSTTDPTNGQYLVYNSTSQKWEPYTPTYSADILVVAGGGGGGSTATSTRGSGGGAGGLIDAAVLLAPGASYTITIGAGGPGAPNAATLPSDANGVNSSVSGSGITTQTAIGGGGAGQNGTDTSSLRLGASGGSGGGGGTNATGSGTFAGGSGTSGQGFAGGTGQHVSGSWATGGGGGGASAVGVSPIAAGTIPSGGNGTNWKSLGTSYAGGGGGAGTNTAAVGLGGTGGGGAGNRTGAGVAGTANTGGGGGGGATGGSGGSGVVIIRYFGPQRGTGGTVTSVGGLTYHTFTTSGTYTA